MMKYLKKALEKYQSTKHKDTIVMLVVAATGIVKTKRERISLSVVDINFKSYPAV